MISFFKTHREKGCAEMIKKGRPAAEQGYQGTEEGIPHFEVFPNTGERPGCQYE